MNVGVFNERKFVLRLTHGTGKVPVPVTPQTKKVLTSYNHIGWLHILPQGSIYASMRLYKYAVMQI